MFRLLLVGAGQLGSRYLQGLARSRLPLSITVVEPCSDSMRTSRERWFEAGGQISNHQIRWLGTINAVGCFVDLVILSTSSHNRLELVKLISKICIPRYWVLEKVLAQSENELREMARALETSDGAWVNTPRRTMKLYQSVGCLLGGEGPFNVTYSGWNWGLACNSIHFIDLVAWWSNESVKSISAAQLDECWTPSKRIGFFEVTGTLSVTYSKGSRLSLTAFKEIAPTNFELRTRLGKRWEIEEDIGLVRRPTGDCINGKFELQSDMTPNLIESILIGNRCDLPSFKESCCMHEHFVVAMLRHWNKSMQRADSRVPIT